MNNMDFVKGFFIVFNPERNKYVSRYSHGGIKTVRGELAVELVENSLKPQSQEVLSFFSGKGKIDYFGVDIDDHETGGWADNMPREVLKERFNTAKKIIGKNPSLIFKSPRGIHAFWFLEKTMPNLVIYNQLKALFEGMRHIEILPTNSHSLRIPSPETYLNDNLEKSDFPGFEALARYPNDAIFKNDLRYENSNGAHKDKVKKARKAHNTPLSAQNAPLSLVQLENEVSPLKNGHTNEVYIKLVAKYKFYGLDEEQAYNRFVNLVKKSPGYSGSLLADLKTRIKTSYKRMTDINLSKMTSHSYLFRDPQVRMAIDNIIKEAGLDIPKRHRMKNSITSFLLNIISWKIACDNIFKDHETAHYWEFNYRGSWWNHGKGYYPLPYSLLRKWNTHYDRPMRLLRDLGVLEESPHHYSTTLKRCKYYRINIICGHLKGDTYYK